MTSQTIFISDLHLSEQETQLNKLFFQSLDEWEGRIDALYILGDFFDAWVGDDDSSPFIDSIYTALKSFTEKTPVYLLHGNRDFLLGEQFEKASGVTLLPEQYVAELYGQAYLFVHGDELCTDDLPYQQFRLQARHPVWQAGVLAKTLAERKMMAEQIRQMSEVSKTAEGKSQMSDATEEGIQALLQQYFAHHSQTPILIHGHTHRPDVHEHLVNGQTIKRYVLQDWYGNEGGYLSLNSQGEINVHKISIA